jgi:hypothetical protein
MFTLYGLHADGSTAELALAARTPSDARADAREWLDSHEHDFTVAVWASDGVGYWSQASEYRWFSPDLEGGTAEPGPDGTANAYATLHETETDDGELGPPLTLAVADIRRAFGLLRLGTPKGWNDTDVRRMLDAYQDCDAGEIDAGDADCIVQVALLGEVVYG